METLFIKLAKAWQVIKRDGVFNGLRRIFEAVFMLFRRVGSGDVLFISGGVGDSALYRTIHVCEELKLNGFECYTTVQDNPRLVNYVDRFHVFVFHRTLYTENIKKMINKIKKQNKTIIFETDDLVYDSKYLKHMDYYNQINSVEKKLYKNGVGGEILTDKYVEVATTTTNFLANKLKAFDKKVFVVVNKLSQTDIVNAQKALQMKPDCSDGKIKLGYFSGTISHNKDFATITKPLVKIMTKYNNVELLLVGPLDVENELIQKFKNRIKQLPYVRRAKHFENVAKCDINLAPLEYNNPFCEAKSELKFFEAGIVKVPTVAVDNSVYRSAIADGVSGFVAADDVEWVDKLSLLIENKKLREKMGAVAFEETLKKYTTKNAKNESYYQYLKEKCNKNLS